MIEGPKLLVEWSSPWREFRSAIGPALGRSPAALAGETPLGLFPLRGILVSWGAEAILLAIVIILPGKLALLQPFRPPTLPKQHEVIYYHGTELPQVQDFGGAQMGKSGRAGGDEAFHKTQTLKVARGNPTSEKVVDAPNLKLPVSAFPVANLLALKPIPGPPPAEGLKTSAAPVFSKNAIIAPPPETLRELRPTPQLDSSVVPPPVNSATDRRRQVMGLSTPIVAPAPNDIPRDQHALVSMNSPVVQPSPADVQREAPPLRGPAASNSSIVPPPVSAPQREAIQAAKLNMPAPAVIAPPPSQVTNDRSVTGSSLSDPKVIPPPVQLGGRSQDPRAIVGMSAATQIVPPPPSVSPGSSLSGGGSGRNQRAGGMGTVLSADNVVPPPPTFGTDGARRGAMGRGGALASADVVPPPPSLGAADHLAGHGSGSRGGGLGGPLDAGSVVAPPSPAGGTGAGKGVVVSSQPGSALGVPGNATAGSLAMSPSGNAKSGLGGAGGGAGLGHGNGPGSGMSGEGSGAAKAGTGKGSDPNSHGGISPYPGPGGAGNGTNGQPPAPGVSISGGSTSTITLPSFGSPDSESTAPGRSPTAGKRRNLDVTVEGTSRSGGAFNFYGMLHGDKVYTKYIPTGSGTVVMQFADATSATKLYSQELTSPEVLLANLPVTLNHSRIIIRCQLDGSGVLRDFHQIEADPGAPTNKVVAALATWKFIPALRGNDPVEVNVLLGFNIDTR
ncbi:MAG: hypothetical protein DMG81_10670 [Acidobacteria bacterium]|nr:MAG: hypothetical protein DMG81_10670 [Acidobacteriota bacterium]